MKSLLAALQFLTVLPLTTSFTNEELLRSVAFFPLVGYLLGAILVAIYLGIWHHVHPLTAAAVVVVLELVLTGALHIDGFMDTADALAAGRGREETLALFRDTHTGAKSVVALVALVLLKVVLMAELRPAWGAGVILVMPVLGRWVQALCLLVFPYARDQGLGTALGAGRPFFWPRLCWALLPVLAGGLMVGWQFWPVLAALTLAGLAAGRYFTARLGGLVGDLYGAFTETSELLGLALFVLLWAVW